MSASAVLFLAWVHYASAIVTANCTVSSDMWMYNSLDQSPCGVAEFLSSPCNGTASTILPLNGSEWYPGAANNPCECNTVMYNLLAACSMCQGGSQQGWKGYSQNCNETYIGQYPEWIVTTTAVPQWAYIDITNTGLLNLNQAKAIGDAPQTTKGSVSTTTVLATHTVSVTASPSRSSKSSSMVAPIVGGVVGGVAGIALLAVGSFFWISRRKRSQVKLLSESSVLGSPSSAAGFFGSPSRLSATPTSPKHVVTPTERLYEAYEPQMQYPRLNTTKPQNNSVSMYVTPSNAYGDESARNNVYRTT